MEKQKQPLSRQVWLQFSNFSHSLMILPLNVSCTVHCISSLIFPKIWLLSNNISIKNIFIFIVSKIGSWSKKTWRLCSYISNVPFFHLYLFVCLFFPLSSPPSNSPLLLLCFSSDKDRLSMNTKQPWYIKFRCSLLQSVHHSLFCLYILLHLFICLH